MPENAAKKSILIIGWSGRTQKVIEEIVSAYQLGEKSHDIIVLSEQRIPREQTVDYESHYGITFFSGDPFDKKLLRRMGADKSLAVIVMADRECEDPDGKTALTVLALAKIIQEENGDKESKPYICAEAINHRKKELILDAGADEVVCHEDYGLGILAQSAISRKLGDVYDDLLSYTPDSNEIYILQGPGGVEEMDISEEIWDKIFAGKGFEEVASFINDHREKMKSNPVILVGVRRGERLFLNPISGEFDQFQRGDAPIFMAYHFPKDSLEMLMDV